MSIVETGAVAVKSTTGLFTAVGIWTGLIAATGAVIIAFIRFGPQWRAQTVKQRADELDKMSQRLDKQDDAIAEAKKAATLAAERAHKAENSLAVIVAVVQLLMSELDKLEPGNKVLLQAREMLGAAMTGDFGMNAAIAKLSIIPAHPGAGHG